MWIIWWSKRNVFEYDGQNLKVCRRKSIKQLSGSVTATFGSGLISGVNTKFQSQLNVGEYIVIRGQSYMVVQIDSDTTCFALHHTEEKLHLI